ncbi:MAG: hypothetical protein ACI854_000421 [Arenicella sp.]|jgi:hypothetical protein
MIWMVFIIAYCKNSKPSAHNNVRTQRLKIMLTVSRQTHLKLKTLAVLLVLSATLILSIEAAKAQSIHYDNNGLKIELSEDVQAAIDSGVSLTFENQYALARHFLIFTWHTKIEQHEFVVTRHTLSNRYLVHQSNKVAPRIFSSTRETMTFISQTALGYFSKYISKHQTQHANSLSEHKMRLRLSKTKLPGPMRLTAFIASDWDLDSGWTSWQSDQL